MRHKLPGLTLRGNTWIVRKGVPADLHTTLGKRELLEWLGTGDLKLAEKLYPAVWNEFCRQIDEARGIKTRAAAPPLDIRPAMIALARWAERVTSHPENYEIPEATDLTTSPQMLTMIEGYQAYFETGDLSVLPDESLHNLGPLTEMTRVMLRTGGLHVAPGHPIIAAMERQAAYHISMAYRFLERERLARAVRLLDLDDATERDLTPKPAEPPAMKLSALYEAWLGTLTVADKEKGRLANQQRRLVETVGDLPINRITKDMISEHMALVSRFPGRKRSAVLDALPMRELIDRFERENAERPDAEKHDCLKASTASEWFGGYQRMFKFAVDKGWLAKSPVEGLKQHVVRGGESTDRRAFVKAEIETIFATPLFRGYDPTAPKGSRHVPGATVTRDAKYWLPIIALLHGARLAEMAAIPLKDVCVSSDGHWYFDLTDRKARRLKNVTSQRVIPLHPQLIALGFLDYVRELQDRKEVWLFPDLDHESSVGPGHGFSKWWGRWMTKVGLSDPDIAFHSFRHTWKRRARETANVKEEMHDVLSGHIGQTVSRQYGPGADIGPLARDMAQIVFPELTLERVASPAAA